MPKKTLIIPLSLLLLILVVSNQKTLLPVADSNYSQEMVFIPIISLGSSGWVNLGMVSVDNCFHKEIRTADFDKVYLLFDCNNLGMGPHSRMFSWNGTDWHIAYIGLTASIAIDSNDQLYRIRQFRNYLCNYDYGNIDAVVERWQDGWIQASDVFSYDGCFRPKLKIADDDSLYLMFVSSHIGYETIVDVRRWKHGTWEILGPLQTTVTEPLSLQTTSNHLPCFVGYDYSEEEDSPHNYIYCWHENGWSKVGDEPVINVTGGWQELRAFLIGSNNTLYVVSRSSSGEPGQPSVFHVLRWQDNTWDVIDLPPGVDEGDDYYWITLSPEDELHFVWILSTDDNQNTIFEWRWDDSIDKWKAVSVDYFRGEHGSTRYMTAFSPGGYLYVAWYRSGANLHLLRR